MEDEVKNNQSISAQAASVRVSQELTEIERQAAELTQKEQRIKRNKRFNRVLYCISGLLMLGGLFIILRSETMLFTKNSIDVPDVTFPPEDDDKIVINVEVPEHTPVPTVIEDDPAAANPTDPPQQTEQPAPEPDAIAPVTIFFEGHNVACRVEPVGVNPDGTMETIPSHNVVGWYMYGPAPNQSGNCIIAGHNRYAGQLGSFSLLHNGLSVGDRVGLQLADGSSLFYRVISLETYPYDNVPNSIMQLGGSTRLTLITCLGDFDYNLQMSKSRVIAVCVPVS